MTSAEVAIICPDVWTRLSPYERIMGNPFEKVKNQGNCVEGLVGDRNPKSVDLKSSWIHDD